MTAPNRPSDYLTPFRRHKYWFLLPFILLFGVALALATLLPPVYQATATIQIEKQEMPADIIETTVMTGYIDEHLEVLARQVLDTENLWSIAEDLDLYPELRDPEKKYVVASAMRRKVARQILYIDVGPEDRRNAESVAVAFTVSFSSDDPEVSRDVTNALAELFVAASRDVRAGQAGQLANFLRATSRRQAEKVAELEQKLADFKEANVASLPEFTGFNLRMLETTQDQTDRIQETINSLMQQRIDLEAQLAQTEPRLNSANLDPERMTPAQQVERLRVEYLRLSSRYTPRHPDFGRVRNELRTLIGEAPRARSVLSLVEELEAERTRMNELRREHGDDHPEVKSLQEQAGATRARLTAMGQANNEEGSAQPDNPAYIALFSRLQGVQAELEAERRKQEQLERRLIAYDGRLLSGAGVEREFRALTREHENAVREYQETRDKQLRAEVAETVEREQMGDRFRLTSPASRPDGPAQPKRAGIAILGFILAIGAGSGMTALAEYLDRSVRGVRGVVSAWGGPPIATIPIIRSRREQHLRMARMLFGWMIVVGVLAGVSILIITYGYMV